MDQVSGAESGGGSRLLVRGKSHAMEAAAGLAPQTQTGSVREDPSQFTLIRPHRQVSAVAISAGQRAWGGRGRVGMDLEGASAVRGFNPTANALY
jgi:hypothetical protein